MMDGILETIKQVFRIFWDIVKTVLAFPFVIVYKAPIYVKIGLATILLIICLMIIKGIKKKLKYLLNEI